MTRYQKRLCIAIIGLFTFSVTANDTFAYPRGGGGRGGGSRGGGGGYRGGGGSRGGGYSRPSYSNHGSVRYSSPRSGSSYSRPSSTYSRPSSGYSRPSSGYSRPSTGYSRPASPTYSRPNYAGSGSSTINRPTARPSTPSYRPSVGSGSGQRLGSSTGGAGINRPSQPIYRPGNSGSIIHGGSVTTPGGSTIGAIRGPRGGGAVGVVGPGGGAAAAVRGPRGGAAAGIRGPYGGAAGAIRGPGGTGIAAARGPLGNRYVTSLPGGSIHYPWNGNDYWCAGFSWYSPYWVGDSMYYGWTYPPEGYYYPSLPEENETVVIDNSTYYVSDGVYYQEGQQDGKPGYVVAAIPESEKAAAEAAAEQENPYKHLKAMCDYISGLPSFRFVAQCTYDQMGEGGEKIQVSERRTLSFSRPGKVAVDVSSDTGKRRAVYDGKSVSMLDLKKNVYTSVPVPETVDAALDKLADEYGIIVPMEDLLYKDLYDRMVSRAAQGRYVSQTKIGDHACHHLAFTTDSSTWEIWVDMGDQPILRKISIDYGIDTERFRYSAEILTWDANPTFSAETFEFKLPGDVKRFELTPIARGK